MEEDFDKDNGDPEHDEEEESFAELFEAYTSGMKDDLQVGDKIRGKIISMGNDSVFLDTGTKIDGVVEKTELLDENGNLSFAEGDEVELYVVAFDENEIRLSRAISGIGGLNLLKDAHANEIPVEGRITGTCKGGFHVDILKRRAFCPISQVDVHFVDAPEQYVGQTHQFLITQFEEKGRNIVVSRRKLLAAEMEKEKEAFFKRLQLGDQLTGRVTKLMPFGAFVELIPGVEGMVHISELSWSRVEKPDDVVRPNDPVAVKVLAVTDAENKNTKKISLSIKRLDKDPWQEAEQQFRPGDKVSGKVTRCMKFGAFVEIAPGIEGLVHISEMSYARRILRTEDAVSPGETISVMVKDVDARGRRISLSLRDAQGDPWLEVAEKYRVGQVVTGTLEKKEKFGYFIALEPGITGLLPKSKMTEGKRAGAIEGLKPGDPVTVTVDEIRHLDRKITLAPGDAAQEGAWKNYAQADAAAPIGNLAEKLRQAMDEKKRK